METFVVGVTRFEASQGDAGMEKMLSNNSF